MIRVGKDSYKFGHVGAVFFFISSYLMIPETLDHPPNQDSDRVPISDDSKIV